MAEVIVNPAYPNMGIARGVDPALAINPGIELFAGERQIVTDQGLFGAAATQHQVIMRSTAADATLNQWVPWDGTAGKELAVSAHTVTAGESSSIYTGAYFNHEALIWPAAVNTVDLRKAAFAHTSISVGKVF